MPIRRLHPALSSTRMRFIYPSRLLLLHDRYCEARFMDSVDMTHLGCLFDGRGLMIEALAKPSLLPTSLIRMGFDPATKHRINMPPYLAIPLCHSKYLHSGG